jgi:hypothetical protein
MERKTDRSIDPGVVQAKARLRAVAANEQIAAGIAWVEANPGKSVAMATGLGIILASSSRARALIMKALAMTMRGAGI